MTPATHLKAKFLDELREVCNTIEIYDEIIDLKSLNLIEESTPKLLIIDDSFLEFFRDREMTKLVHMYSHHARSANYTLHVA